MKKLKVCSLDDIPSMGGRLVIVEDKNIALFRTTDDKVFALENKCPHKSGPLVEGVITGKTLICPLHMQKIDMEKGEMLPPDEGCLETYKVSIKGSEVWLGG